MSIYKIYADRDYVDSKILENIPTPTTATVGQTIVVKAVDENGKPTEWEAKDVVTQSGVTEERVNELIAEALANIPNAEEASF